MKKTVLIVLGLAFAVLVGRYIVPSRSSGSARVTSTESAALTAQREPETQKPPAGVVTRSAQPVPRQPDAENADLDVDDPQPANPVRADVATARTGVIVNRRELTRDQVLSLAATYHYMPPPGRYWYDSMSGAWGIEGHETAGFLMTGHDFGPLAADASSGNTGVFVNGRELNLIEALRIKQSLGAVYQGRWWLDGRTGNFGAEGNPMPQGNIIAALRAQQSTRRGDNFWCSTTACGNDDGHTGYVDVGGTIVTYDH